MNKSSGLSLVEVLVAAGVASGILLAVSSNMMTTARSSKKITIQNNWSQQIDLIRTAMNDPNLCSTITTGWNLPAFSPPQLNSQPNFSIPISGISNFLTAGQTTNGIQIPQNGIVLKAVPNFKTLQAEDLFSDQVYLEITAKQIVTASDSTSNNPINALFSGYTAAGQAVNPVTFTLIRDSSGLIKGCMGTKLSCADLGGNYVAQPQNGHLNHGDPACQITTLKLAPNLAPGNPISGSASILFGDPFTNNDTTTPNTPAPDSIVDNLATNTLTLTASGTLVLNGNMVNLGSTSSITSLSVYGNATIGSTSSGSSLMVNNSYLLDASCSPSVCPGSTTCSCQPGYSLVSGGVDCGSSGGIASSSGNGTSWSGSCTGGGAPVSVTAYCCKMSSP